MSGRKGLEARFERAREVLLGELVSGEALSMEFAGDDTLYMRFSGGKVRQLGGADAAYVSFRLFRDGRSILASFPVAGDAERDADLAARLLAKAREDADLLPPDPYRKPPSASATSSVEFTGNLPMETEVVEAVLAPAAGFDLVGIHQQGPQARGAATSSGARHWFQTETFATDWSMWLPNGKAVKSCYAGREWDGAEHARRLGEATSRLDALARHEKVLEPGSYRAFIAPDALAEVLPFFSWNGLSERDFREGRSAWLALREGRKSLSPAFTLAQDFGLGLEPRFNELGELAPERLPLIEGGKLLASLVSERSSNEYAVPSNQAPDWEGLRSPSVGAGTLETGAALAALGTGVYVSNFHYLNWSDIESARITGMTRFACFWVEGGKIVAPIKDMRFDESLYELLGDSIEAVTVERSLSTNIETYGLRNVGGALLPGILVSRLAFTL